MATAAFSAAGSGYSKIDSTTAMALVLRRTAAGKYENRPLVRDVSEIFFKLKHQGFKLRDIALRKIPGGFYSEDVEGFVGQLLSMGYASERSPIKLTKDGDAFCNKIVREEKNQEDVVRLEGLLERLLRDWPAAV